ncbi:unnamed protein product [Pylaiella littoralis]
MTMKNDFCDELVDKCEDQIIFPDYPDGETYCEKHTGGSDDVDNFWSYPYTQPEIFDSDLAEVFDFDVGEGGYPAQLISMKTTPDGSQWWLAGQLGQIKSVDTDNLETTTDVVDLADLSYFYEAFEEGLLDFAFGPLFGQSDYPDYFYTSYTVRLTDDENPRNRLSRFTYIADDPSGILATQDVLIDTKRKFNSIHAAGWVGFKPSDYARVADEYDIFWTTGDGGPQLDPTAQSQDSSNLLGSLVRVTVESGFDTSGYSIPSGNQAEGREENCAIGLRNPFRCGYDKETDELFCGDVGHTNVEEINLMECGKNYGWSQFEGSRCHEAVQDLELFINCEDVDRDDYEFAWFEYCHPDYDSDADEQADFTGGVNICGDRLLTGGAVIGGPVYRGMFFADLLDGALIFGDNVNSNVYFVKNEMGELITGTIISDRSFSIISFAEDANGEIMLISRNGRAYHMPCGDLCASTCLEQADVQPSVASEGCYGDSKDDRVLPNAGDVCGNGERLMSPELCGSHCALKYPGAVYAGVEFGSECYCGYEDADFDKLGALEAESCNFPCTANPEHLCGGFNAIEVFKLGEPEFDDDSENPLVPVEDDTVPTIDDAVFSYVGCYFDPVASRSMLLKTRSDDTTAENCAGYCSGTAFFGTQHADECWCGGEDAEAIFEANGEDASACNEDCTGDSSETCGGFLAMSVYSSQRVVDDDGGGTGDDELPGVDHESVAPEAGGYEGCFADPKGNRSMAKVATTDDMTSEECSEMCPGFPYYGTQHSTECWCGGYGADAIFTANGEGSCTYDCAGDPSETCGGFFAMSVYSADVTAPDGYVGCYADSKDSRSMEREAVTANMTPTACSEACSGFPYYGTQYSSECWCGRDGAEAVFTANGESLCDYICSGDSSEICGGYNAMSVYSA